MRSWNCTFQACFDLLLRLLFVLSTEHALLRTFLRSLVKTANHGEKLVLLSWLTRTKKLISRDT